MSPVTIPTWTPPWPPEGQATFLRISASSLSGDSRWICAEQVAKKARPQVGPQRDRSVRQTYAPFASVPIGLVQKSLYSVLAKGVDIDRGIAQAVADEKAEVAEQTLVAVRAGITGYLETLAQLREHGDLPDATVVRDFIALDRLDASIPPRVEWYGWGLMHTSRDSAIREYHLLTWSRAGQRHRSNATIGVYARIAADAVCVDDGTAWWEPRTETAAQPRPGREVRVREIGLLDRSTHLLYSDTVEAARAFFDTHVPPALPVLAGGSYQPTSRCASCSLRTECDGIPRLPGLLGVIGQSTWPRALSPGDLAQGRTCTWRIHLSRTLGLPSAGSESSAAMRRGSDIHAWLEISHAHREPCSLDELPPDHPGPIAEQLGWDLDRYLALRPYLISHLDTCPLRTYDPENAFPEVSMGAWDTDADVVVSTRADLVITDGERRIVRETKTVYDTDDSMTDTQLLHRYPQVALTLCLMADGVDPLTGEVLDSPTSGGVELEFLSVDSATVRSFDAGDPETVLAARTQIAEAADNILYTDPEPNPGRWCDYCPVSQWCTAPRGESADASAWSEDSDTKDAHVPGSRTALLALAETAVDTSDDDIPF